MKDVLLESIFSEYPENHHDIESFRYTISNENLLNPFQSNVHFCTP